MSGEGTQQDDDSITVECAECGLSGDVPGEWRGLTVECKECGERLPVPGRAVLDHEEARRVANSLEMLYYDTKESAYDATDEQAARDAMTIRERAGIEPNPELLDRSVDTESNDE